MLTLLVKYLIAFTWTHLEFFYCPACPQSPYIESKCISTGELEVAHLHLYCTVKASYEVYHLRWDHLMFLATCLLKEDSGIVTSWGRAGNMLKTGSTRVHS